MLDTVKINHVQHISFTQSRLTDAVSVILSELLSYEHPSNDRGIQKHKYYFLDLKAPFPQKAAHKKSPLPNGRGLRESKITPRSR